MLLQLVVGPVVQNLAGYLLTNALKGGTKRSSRRSSGLLGSLTRGLSLPILLLVGFVSGYGYKSFAEHEVPDTAGPEVVRYPGQISWQLYFSPNGGCTDAIVRELRKAQREVQVMAYSFTSKPIATALVDCHRRGVRVEVVLDKGQRGEKYTEADFIAHAGIPTYLDGKHAIHHNKVVLIDDETVITGSFNFSSSAELRNAENLLVVRDPEMVRRYRYEWQRHQMHSERHVGRGTPPPELGVSKLNAPIAPQPPRTTPPPVQPQRQSGPMQPWQQPAPPREPQWQPWRPGQ